MCENVDSFVVPICEAENAAKDVHGGSVVGVNILIKSQMSWNLSYTQKERRFSTDPFAPLLGRILIIGLEFCFIFANFFVESGFLGLH